MTPGLMIFYTIKLGKIHTYIIIINLQQPNLLLSKNKNGIKTYNMSFTVAASIEGEK
jgi:hypothetical protein